MNSLLAVLLVLTPSACRAVPQQPQAFWVQDGAVSSASGTGEGYVQLSVDNDNGQLLLVLHGDTVTALLDGQVLPADRVVREGDKLTVRGVGGESLFEVRVIPGTHSLVHPYDAKAWAVTPGGLYATGAGWSGTGYGVAERRKLIGITTASVDEALRAQLGLEDEAFLVESVNDDMPADRGGMQPWDVVTAIEGEPGASTDRLREALDGKEPGETLSLTVLRKGESRELTLTVEEPRETGVFRGATGDSLFPGMDSWRHGVDSRVMQELLATHAGVDVERARLADQLAKVEAEIQKVSQRDSAEAARRLAELAGKQASLTARQAELDAESARRASELALFKAGEAGDRWLMLPPVASGATADTDRLALLEERLARLEELLERLAARGSADVPAPDADDGEQP